jgi:hypothetical protein
MYLCCGLPAADDPNFNGGFTGYDEFSFFFSEGYEE